MAVLVGLVMALLATGAAWLIAMAMPLSQFPGIYAVCYAAGVGPDACQSGAIAAASTSTGAIALAVLVYSAAAWWAVRRFPARRRSLDPSLIYAVLTVTMGVVAAHLVAIHFGPVYASRVAEVAGYSNYVSLENLLWPLLLQLLVLETDRRFRLAILAVLLAVVSLTPFRAVILAVVVFGFAVPIATATLDAFRTGWPKGWQRQCGALVLAALVIAASGWWGLYAERSGRDSLRLHSQIVRVENNVVQQWALEAARAAQRSGHARTPPTFRPLVPTVPRPSLPGLREPKEVSSWYGLAQRIVSPAYQAAVLEHVASIMDVPTLMDEFRNKFRLSDALTLNEFLYQKFYGGTGTGQTTTLYYGEAVAYFPAAPLAWMIAAPLALLLAWLGLRLRVVAADTLFGIALWRSSLAGVVTILPALVLQVVAVAAMAMLGDRLPRRQATQSRIAAAARWGFAAGAIMLLAGQAWMAIERSTRDTIWLAAVASPDRDCAFTGLESNPAVLSRALTRQGVNSVPYISGGGLSVQGGGPVLILVDVPGGSAAAGQMPTVMAGLRPLMRCDNDLPPPLPVLTAQWFIPRNGNLYFEILSAILLAAAAITSLWRGRRARGPIDRWLAT